MIHARSEWTTRVVPNPSPQRHVETAFFHHEGGPIRGNPNDKPAVLRSIEAYVIGKGYSAIDYNLMVFQDGSIWEGRGLGHEDAATLGWNARSVSICAVGNFDKEDPTDELVWGIGLAIRAAADTGWLTGVPAIMGHKESGFSTACPGAKLFAQKEEIIKAFWGMNIPWPAPKGRTDMLRLIRPDKQNAVYAWNGVQAWWIPTEDYLTFIQDQMRKAGYTEAQVQVEVVHPATMQLIPRVSVPGQKLPAV